MTEPNIHIRAARAHLKRAEKPTFADDTMRGLLDEIDRLRIRLQGCRDVLWMTKLVREEGYTLATARKIGCEDNYGAYGAQGLARRVKIATDCAIANADRQLSDNCNTEKDR